MGVDKKINTQVTIGCVFSFLHPIKRTRIYIYIYGFIIIPTGSHRGSETHSTPGDASPGDAVVEESSVEYHVSSMPLKYRFYHVSDVSCPNSCRIRWFKREFMEDHVWFSGFRWMIMSRRITQYVQ